MKKIDKPSVNISTVVSDSINNLRDEVLRDEVIANLARFQDFENDFESKIQSNQLFQIARNRVINTNINYEFLKKLYTQRMLNKNNVARRFYDQIIISAPKGKCPNCNHRQANTLDHYLPKSEYPILSVSPINLIPSCSNCNTGKLINYPTSSENEAIHPYYDDIDGVNWLKCSIINLRPLLYKFSVIDSAFSTIPFLNERLKNHFKSFELNKLYKTQSSEEFENIKYQIEKLFNNGGSAFLKEYLFDCYESRQKTDVNSWQTAFYKCLYESHDFCNGRFI
jgi:5-methylcytosine-specific restriction endonuclease McrA